MNSTRLDQAVDRGRKRRERAAGDSESALERLCGDIAARHGALFWKMRLVGRRGGPDRILMLPHLPVVFVELKVGDNRQSALQRQIESELHGVGQRYWLIYSALGFEERLKAFKLFETGRLQLE